MRITTAPITSPILKSFLGLSLWSLWRGDDQRSATNRGYRRRGGTEQPRQQRAT